MQMRVVIGDSRGLSLGSPAVRPPGLTVSASFLIFMIDDNDGGGLGFLVEGIANLCAGD